MSHCLLFLLPNSLHGKKGQQLKSRQAQPATHTAPPAPTQRKTQIKQETIGQRKLKSSRGPQTTSSLSFGGGPCPLSRDRLQATHLGSCQPTQVETEGLSLLRCQSSPWNKQEIHLEGGGGSMKGSGSFHPSLYREGKHHIYR